MLRGANLTIHTCLLCLEGYCNMPLSPVQYHQTDGSPEKANTEFYQKRTERRWKMHVVKPWVDEGGRQQRKAAVVFRG